MIILLFILWFLAGACKGVRDSVDFHTFYKKFGEWWSMDSWTDRKFMGQFVPNAWHIFDYSMTGLLFISLFTMPLIGYDPKVFIAPVALWLGFILTYKS